jgi:branched-chain amino acid transport system ATP-binding protein
MLVVRDLAAAYGPIQALHDVALEVAAGEVAAVIGPNGAGKSTLLNTIVGMLRPRRGTVRFDGRDVTGYQPERLVGLGLALVPERRQVFAELSVEDNLRLGAYTLGRAAQRDADRVYELFPILRERGRQLAGTLSGGEQQMLAIGRGLMSRPKLLMLDEPSLGLAPLVAREIMATIRALPTAGTTVLLVEQNARAAVEIADRAYVLEAGRVALAGPARAVLADEQVQRTYLGRNLQRRP